MSPLTSCQALELSAYFVFISERMRAADSELETRTSLWERASRVAFLRAQAIARDEEARPTFGTIFRHASFAVA